MIAEYNTYDADSLHGVVDVGHSRALHSSPTVVAW